MNKSYYPKTHSPQKASSLPCVRTPAMKTPESLALTPHVNAKAHARFGPSFSASSSPLILQTKMTVSPVGDTCEREADSVARQVVGQMQSPTVQRAGAEDELQMKGEGIGASGGAVNSSVESTIQGAKGSGSPLPDTVRQPMEQAFGADFSKVRVHNDSTSDSLNRSIQAKAFTTGSDVFFRSGEYQPNSASGQELLAHELTHTIQQRAAKSVQRKPWTGLPPISRQTEHSHTVQRDFTHKFEGDVGMAAGMLKDHDKKFKVLMERYTEYRKAKDDIAKANALNSVVQVARRWKQEYGAKYPDSNKLRDCDTILYNSRSELESLYMKKMKAGGFQYLTHGGRSAPDHTKEETEAANNAGISPSEVTGLKVYTGADYQYINPVEAKNDKWLGGAAKGMAGPEMDDKKNITGPTWWEDPVKVNKTSKDGKNTIREPELRTAGWLAEMNQKGPTAKQSKELKREARQHIEMLKPALVKLPNWSGETYRGAGFEREKIEKEYATSAIVDFGTFASSSVKRNVAENFAKDNTKGTKVGILMVLQLVTGKDLAQFSAVKSEAEITIMPGIKFKVVNLSPPGQDRNYYIAEMQEQ